MPCGAEEDQMSDKDSVLGVIDDDSRRVRYQDSSGKEIVLSIGMIKRYLVSGDPALVTDSEVVMFMQLCKYRQLNPFTREAYLVKFSSSSPAALVVAYDTYVRRVDDHPKYKGMRFGTIVLGSDGKPVERAGTLVLEGEKLVGGWVTVWRADWAEPFHLQVGYSEYVGVKDGKPNKQWAKMPGWMIVKCAVSVGLRMVFPGIYSKMYTAEERGFESEDAPPDRNVTPEEMAMAEKAEAERPAQSVAAANGPATDDGRAAEMLAETKLTLEASGVFSAEEQTALVKAGAGMRTLPNLQALLGSIRSTIEERRPHPETEADQNDGQPEMAITGEEEKA